MTERKYADGARVRWAHKTEHPSDNGQPGTVVGFDRYGNGLYTVEWDDGNPWSADVHPDNLVPANDFAAGWNVCTYSPDPDNVSYFDTPEQAWSHLSSELRRWLEDPMVDEPDSGAETFEQSLQEMRSLQDESKPGTVYSATPDYDGDHDLGYAWWVRPSE